MTNEAQVETPEPQEAPQDTHTEVEQEEQNVEANENEQQQDVTDAEPKEETVEEKLARLDALEKKTQAAEKKIMAQRKAYTALQKAAQEKDQKLQEFLSKNETENEPQKPVVDDFDTYEEYQKAQDAYVDELAEFKAKKAVVQERQNLLEQERQAAFLKVQAERNSQYEKEKGAFVIDNPDFAHAEEEFNVFVQDAQQTTDPRVQDAVVEQAYAGGNVPALINYFGSNNGERLSELSEISKLSPARAAVEIYKIQQKLKAINPVTKKESPKPPKTVKGKTTTSKDLSKGDVLKNLGLK